MPGEKPVLHEVLAVEQGLAETANRITKEVIKTLGTKQTIFEGLTKSHVIFNEDNQNLVQATEVKEVQSTVNEQIDFLNVELARYYDVCLQKEEANQRAKADIIINGAVLVPDVPAIVLLGMEKKLTALLAVYNAIPTLDAAKAWIPAEGYAKEGVFQTKHHTERQHAVTTKKWITVSPATDNHQAQVKEKDDTEIIGKYILNEFSGAVSSYDKAERIKKLTALIRAVKKARQRANNVEIKPELTFGKVLLDYINN